MSKTADRTLRNRISAALIPLSILAGSALVWQSTEAAFADTTTTSTDQFNATSAALNILASREGNDVFGSLANREPDASLESLTLPINGGGADGGYSAGALTSGGSACVRVENVAALAAKVRMYATVTGTGLASHMLFSVDYGSGSALNCSDFESAGAVYGGSPNSTQKLSTFPATWAGAAANEWSATAGPLTYRTYRIAWLIPAGTTSVAANLNSDVTFTWEAR